jgi:hypothetical protein
MASITIRLFDETAAFIKPSVSVTSLDEEEGCRSAPFTSSPLDEFRGGFETALKCRVKVRDASKKNTKSPVK